MIVGIGTDLCDVRRVCAALERHGDRFAWRILGPAERQVYEARRQQAAGRAERFLATRFAVKEAFAKAWGTGMRHPMNWHSCETLSDPMGRPYVVLHGEVQARAELAGWRVHVSISDESDHVLAFVVLESTDARIQAQPFNPDTLHTP